jgi:hypothetical protein
MFSQTFISIGRCVQTDDYSIRFFSGKKYLATLRFVNKFSGLCENSIYRRPSLFAVFLSEVSLICSPKTAFFEETILQFKPYIGLFIRGFVIRGPIFEKRIYRE